MELWFWLLVVVATITVDGHGIWVILAWLLRGCHPKLRTSAPVRQTHCPRCDTRIVCGDCGTD